MKARRFGFQDENPGLTIHP